MYLCDTYVPMLITLKLLPCQVCQFLSQLSDCRIAFASSISHSVPLFIFLFLVALPGAPAVPGAPDVP